MNLINQRKNIKLCYFMAFIIPLGILLCVIGYLKIWPFGGKSLLVWDMEIQYLNIYNWFHDVLHGDANLFYDFSKSLGGNMYGVFAAYLASPINFLVYFFPADKIVYFITISTVLKICLSGLFCQIFLTKRFEKGSPIFFLFLSTSFSLMEYNVALCSNLHFLDVIYMLPLVALGVYFFVSCDRKFLLCLSVAYIIFCNWYIAYMVCLFILFYYLFELFLSKYKYTIVTFLKKTLRFCIWIILGILIGSVTFIPSIMATLNGKGEVSYEYLIPQFHCSFFAPMKAFLLSSQANVSYEEPAIYVGGLVLAVILVGMLDKRINIKTRIYSLVFICFVFISFSFVPFEVIWTGFKKTYSFHFRYSFVFSFLLVVIAALFWEEISYKKEMMKMRVAVLSLGVLAVIGVWGRIKQQDSLEQEIMYLFILAVYVILLCWSCETKKAVLKGILGCGTAVLLVIELGCNTQSAFEKYKIPCDEYSNYAAQIEKQIDEIIDGDASFYRLEKTFSEMDKRRGTKRPVAGEGLTFNYNAISHYSSLYDSVVNDFLSLTGYCKKNAMMSNYVDSNPVMDSVLGVKYILSDNEYCLLDKKGTFSYRDGNEINIYKNEYALSFATQIKAKKIKQKWTNDPFINQELILTSMLGTNPHVFKTASVKEEENSCWNITVNETGPVYAYFGCGHSDKDVLVNGEYKETYFGRFYKNVMYLGNYKKGEVLTVSLNDDCNCNIKHNLFVYSVNEESYEQAFHCLKQHSISPDIMKDSYVKLTWSADETETLLLSVPYDEGWNIYINGKKCKYSKAFGSLISIKIPKGVSEIEMRYRVPYFCMGCIISLLGICCLAIYGIFNVKKIKDKK